MILHHQLNTAPVRAADAVPTQQRFEQQRRERLARIQRAAHMPRPAPAVTVRHYGAVRPLPPAQPETQWPDYAEPVPYETMEFGRVERRPVTARDIIDQVTIKYGVSRADLMGHSRRAHMVTARREASYRIRHEVLINGRQPSLPEIARYIGHRDHSTVLYNIRKFEAELAAGKGA